MKSTIISLQITILICFSALSLAFAGYDFFPGKGFRTLINEIEDSDTGNPGIIVIDNDISLIHLHDSAYMHVTWDESEMYGRFSSNGMIFIKSGKALMIDTPMDNDKTRRLCEFLEISMNVEVVKLVIGHYHDDCLGGLEYIHGKGIGSIANRLTVDKCIGIGLPVPSTSFTDIFTLDFMGETIECRFFGGGHSFDNITVWISSCRILFGGCLVKSLDSKGLGNLADAVTDEWEGTVRKIVAAYPEINTVVPGHGNQGGPELLDHTIQLVKAFNRLSFTPERH
jgi:metallo-beta-lactamase class B